MGGQRSRNLSRKGFTGRHYITSAGQVLKSVLTMGADVSKKLRGQIATQFKPSNPSLTVMYTPNAWENDLSVVEGTYRQETRPCFQHRVVASYTASTRVRGVWGGRGLDNFPEKLKFLRDNFPEKMQTADKNKRKNLKKKLQDALTRAAAYN